METLFFKPDTKRRCVFLELRPTKAMKSTCGTRICLLLTKWDIPSDTFYQTLKVLSHFPTTLEMENASQQILIKCTLLDLRCTSLKLNACHYTSIKDLVHFSTIVSLKQHSTDTQARQAKVKTNQITYFSKIDFPNLTLRNVRRRVTQTLADNGTHDQTEEEEPQPLLSIDRHPPTISQYNGTLAWHHVHCTQQRLSGKYHRLHKYTKYNLAQATHAHHTHSKTTPTPVPANPCTTYVRAYQAPNKASNND